jgi:hypothetical protein
MVTRIAIGLGIAAALIPVSLLLGLPAAKSIFVSVVVGLLFIGLASAMSKLIR